MNKHHLSQFRRSPLVKFACLALLAFMFAPAAIFAGPAVANPLPLANLGGFNPMLLGAIGVGGAALYLRNKAGDEGESGGGGKTEEPISPEAALKVIEDRTMPMSQRLGVAVNALRGIPPSQQMATLQTQLNTAEQTITTKDGEIGKLKTDLEAANQRIKALETDVSGLEQSNSQLEKRNKELEAKEQDISTRASTQAKELVRAVGVDAKTLPGAEDSKTKKPEERIRELKGNQRVEAGLYFQQHGKLPSWMEN